MYQVDVSRAVENFERLQLKLSRTRRNMDGVHSQLAKELLEEGRRLYEEGARRPQDRGYNQENRSTGMFFGARNVVKGRLINPGSDRKVKGLEWPDVEALDRAMGHWRLVEGGADYTIIPGGHVFLYGSRKGRDSLFRRYSDAGADDPVTGRFYKPAVGRGYPGRRIIEQAWNNVMTESNIGRKYVNLFKVELREFDFRYSP